VNDERVEVAGQASHGRAEAALLELVDQSLQSLLGIAFVDRLIERLPVGRPDPLALGFGELGQQVAHSVHSAVLTIAIGPAVLDRLDQPRGAVGDDQHRRAQAAGDQIAAERLPVLIGLAHPQHHRQQHAFAGVGKAPGDQHALLRAARPHGQERRIEEQRDEPDLVEIAALKRWKRSRSSEQIRAALAFETLPSPASSHSDSTSRIDSPRTNAPITNAFNGSVRNSFVPRGNSRETNGAAASRTCGISTDSSPSAVCSVRARNPLRMPASTSGRRS
jgi:hypothetical protein